MTEKLKTSTHLKTVAIDFDGVLHAYTTPWSGAATISDGPTPGAMAFLASLVADPRFQPVIVSSRLNDPAGQPAIEEWLSNHLVAELGHHDACYVHDALWFSATRPPAHVTLDDRGITFLGEWPSLDRLAAFQPYYKKPRHLRPDPETAVAAVDALMTRIGRVASETGCPDGVPALDWLEERARIGQAVASTEASKPDRLAAEFLPFAAVEAIIVAAVTPSTPVSRASAAGEIGWRVGYGWMSASGCDLAQPERIRDFARSLAALPGMTGEKPRAGDPELVAKTLAAGRAM